MPVPADRRQRFVFEEIPGVFFGAARPFTIGALRDDAFRPGHVHLLGAFEFARRKTEANDPLYLRDEGVEPPRNAFVRDKRLDDRQIAGSRCRKKRSIRGGLQERWILGLRKLVETRSEHGGKQLIPHDVAIAADRALIASRSKIEI